MGLFDGEIYTIKNATEAEVFLNKLSDQEFNFLQSDWITQIWLYENEPPTTAEALRNYGPFCLVEEFKKAFCNGDYARISLGIGTSLDEGILLQQIYNGVLQTGILSEKIPQRPEFATYAVVPHLLLLSAFPLFLNAAQKAIKRQFGSGPVYPVYLVDGDMNHAIHVKGLSDDRKFIIYDEYWWKGQNGLSFFSAGQNSDNTDAELIDPLFNTFKVSQDHFWKFFMGFVMWQREVNLFFNYLFQMQTVLAPHYPALRDYNPSQLLINGSLSEPGI